MIMLQAHYRIPLCMRLLSHQRIHEIPSKQGFSTAIYKLPPILLASSTHLRCIVLIADTSDFFISYSDVADPRICFCQYDCFITFRPNFRPITLWQILCVPCLCLVYTLNFGCDRRRRESQQSTQRWSCTF